MRYVFDGSVQLLLVPDGNREGEVTTSQLSEANQSLVGWLGSADASV